jgi:hypothetical protein
MAVALLLLAWAAYGALALFARHQWAALTFPYPLDYGEGPILDQALRLARFTNIYRADLSAPPYTISNYPPVYPLAHVPFVWLFGPAFWYGRAISLLGALAAAAFVGLTLHAITRDAVAAAAAGVTLLCFPYLLHWAAFDRVDSLALGLSWGGLWALARWPESRRALYVAAALLLAAIFTRQSYALAAPMAAFVWLLRHSWRRALLLAGVVAGAGALLLALLQLVTWGGFYFNIVTANVNPFHWDEVRRRAEDEIWAYMPYLALCAAAFALCAAWARQQAWWLAAPYLLGATVSAITIGKSGSNVNYLFELSAALALTAGAALAWAQGRWGVRASLTVLLAAQIAIMGRWSLDNYFYRAMDKVEQRAEIDRMMELVRAADGPVLADEYMGLVPLAGKPLVIQPFEIKQLDDARLWDDQPFLQQIARREFPLILIYHLPGYPLHADRWGGRMLNSIDTHYDHVDTILDTWVYRPRAQ